jgi:hypothetical protein
MLTRLLKWMRMRRWWAVLVGLSLAISAGYLVQRKWGLLNLIGADLLGSVPAMTDSELATVSETFGAAFPKTARSVCVLLRCDNLDARFFLRVECGSAEATNFLSSLHLSPAINLRHEEIQLGLGMTGRRAWWTVLPLDATDTLFGQLSPHCGFDYLLGVRRDLGEISEVFLVRQMRLRNVGSQVMAIMRTAPVPDYGIMPGNTEVFERRWP